MGGGVSVESDPRMVNLRQSTKEEIQKYIQSIQSSSASSSSSSRPPNEDDKVEIDIDDEIKRILRLFRQGDKESSNSNTVNTSPPKTTAESEVVASSSIVKKKTVEEGKESSSMAVIAPLRKSRRRSISFTASSLNTRNLRPLTASTAAASSSGTSSSSRAIAEGTRRKMNEYSKNYLSATKSSASKLGINPNQLLLADRMRPNGLLLSSLSASTAQEEHDGEQSIEQAADMQSLDGYGRQDLNMTLIEEAFEEQKDVWSSPKMLNFSSDLSQSNDGSSIVDTTSSQFRRNSPYCCEICKIRFTSETLLQKHIQFSDKHKWGLEERHKLLLIAQRADKIAALVHNCIFALKKRTLTERCYGKSKAASRWIFAIVRVINQLAQAKTEEMLIELLANSSAASKEEEEDVKIIEIYNGSKIFWYLKETLSLVFYHHAYVNCIEIVAFNPRINRELNRLYINQPVLKNFTLEYIKSMTRVQYKEFSHLAYGVQENVNYDRQYNDRLKSNPQSMVTLILSRLSLEEIYGHVLPHLYFRKYAIDPVVETVLFNDRPEALHPISMIRRRWTSVQKFHSKYNAFHTDLLALNVATLRAERLASHLRLGVEAFKAAAKRTGGGGGSEGSVGQLRFRRILRLLAVEETKKALASTNYHQHKTIAAYH